MKKILFTFLCLSVLLLAQEIKTTDVNVCAGKILRVENFNSEFVSARNVDIWLPENYSKDKKYSVLYMHDGQMLFDSTTTWNKQEWKVDEVLTSLMNNNEIEDCFVVAIWNSDKGRHPDYFPKKAFEKIPQKFVDSLNANAVKKGYIVFNPEMIQSDNYLKFIVKELKPFIDENFSTRPERENTFISGSSMGGLISMYAICEYPEVFGGAACISTHWLGFGVFPENPVPQAFADYLDENLPSPEKVKIYFDYGTETLDQHYEPGQNLADNVMRKHKFTKENWITKKFPGENHSERSWQKRLHIPVKFLLGK